MKTMENDVCFEAMNELDRQLDLTTKDDAEYFAAIYEREQNGEILVEDGKRLYSEKLSEIRTRN